MQRDGLARLPGAGLARQHHETLRGRSHPIEVGEEEVTFRFVPEGAEAGEEVAVIVSDGKIQVHESTKAGKHTDKSRYDTAMEESGLGWAK